MIVTRKKGIISVAQEEIKSIESASLTYPEYIMSRTEQGTMKDAF